jgi:hypothetical protein
MARLSRAVSGLDESTWIGRCGREAETRRPARRIDGCYFPTFRITCGYPILCSNGLVASPEL